jgi:transcriptional regulator GlxA family with amidase domain
MRVAMMLYAGFQLLEVSGPMDVFHEANRLYGGTFYEQHLVGPSPGPVLSSNGTTVGTTECLADTRTPFDIVMVPGSPVPGAAHEHRALVAWLSKAGPTTQRLACISSGALLVARAGLANGRWLTTHWREARRLAARHPSLRVIASPGSLRDGKLYSSGGAGAGIHLALALVKEDLGEKVASNIAGALAIAV